VTVVDGAQKKTAGSAGLVAEGKGGGG